MPAPLLTYGESAEYAGSDPPGLWLEAIRQMAANAVAQVAPRPDPMPDDYRDSARAAELLLGAYLWENRGRYSSLSGEDGSISYVPWETQVSIVAQTMPAEWMGHNRVVISRGGP